MIGRDGFAQLLDRPRCRRGCRDMVVQDATGRVFHNHEHREEAKRSRDHNAAITGHDGLGMSAHKRPPVLGRHAMPSTMVEALRPILPHGPW
jgi:hypothetical protein